MSYDIEQRPVIVEVTTTHVVWVDGDDQDEALANANRYPWYELIRDGQTDVITFAKVSSPADRYDWDEVYEPSYSGGYSGREYDAHVETHRAELQRQQWAAEKAACIEAGHPNREAPIWDGRTWCPGCREHLPAPATVGGDSR